MGCIPLGYWANGAATGRWESSDFLFQFPLQQNRVVLNMGTKSQLRESWVTEPQDSEQGLNTPRAGGRHLHTWGRVHVSNPEKPSVKGGGGDAVREESEAPAVGTLPSASLGSDCRTENTGHPQSGRFCSGLSPPPHFLPQKEKLGRGIRIDWAWGKITGLENPSTSK